MQVALATTNRSTVCRFGDTHREPVDRLKVAMFRQLAQGLRVQRIASKQREVRVERASENARLSRVYAMPFVHRLDSARTQRNRSVVAGTRALRCPTDAVATASDHAAFLVATVARIGRAGGLFLVLALERPRTKIHQLARQALHHFR